MDINWANPLTWVAAYLAALAVYTMGWSLFAFSHLMLKPLRFLGKVALVSVPVTAVIYGASAGWSWLAETNWGGLGQAILDWMGWVTANVVIVSGIGLAWVIVVLSARTSWQEWFETKKNLAMTKFERTNEEAFLDIGPADVASDYWQGGKDRLADLVAVVQEWKVGDTDSTLSAEDDTLELPVIPDVMADEDERVTR